MIILPLKLVNQQEYLGVTLLCLALNPLYQASDAALQKKTTFYIGSTTDFNTRYKIHKTNSGVAAAALATSTKKSLQTPLYASVKNLG